MINPHVGDPVRELKQHDPDVGVIVEILNERRVLVRWSSIPHRTYEYIEFLELYDDTLEIPL